MKVEERVMYFFFNFIAVKKTNMTVAMLFEQFACAFSLCFESKKTHYINFIECVNKQMILSYELPNKEIQQYIKIILYTRGWVVQLNDLIMRKSRHRYLCQYVLNVHYFQFCLHCGLTYEDASLSKLHPLKYLLTFSARSKAKRSQVAILQCRSSTIDERSKYLH